MSTLRAFILAQSALPSGYTVREHILNPKASNKTIYQGLLEIDMVSDINEIDVVQEDLGVEVSSDSTEVEVDSSAVEVEVEK